MALKQSMITKLGSLLAKWGPWQASLRGVSKGLVRFEFSRPGASSEKALHEVRADWRSSQLKGWLSSNRLDSAMARRQRLRILPQLVDKLHKGVKRLNAYEVGVLTGGFKSPAVHFCNHGAILQQCMFCNQHVVPSLDHILWQCPTFQNLRSCARPRCPLGARLGWNAQGVHACITQLGD